MLAIDLQRQKRVCPGKASGHGSPRPATEGGWPYLCTVWEETKKDMRSPGVSSSPAMREPPRKMVPRTTPGGGDTQDRSREEAVGLPGNLD